MLNTYHTTFNPSPSHFVPPGEFNPDLLIFPASEKRSWKTEHLRNSHPTADKNKDEPKHTKADFDAAKDLLKLLVADLTLSPLEAAQAYEAAWPDLTAEPLRYSERKQSQKAWSAFYGEKEKDTRRMFKLFACLNHPCRYIITAKDLDLPPEFEISARFYDKTVNKTWKKAIEKLFNTKNRNNVIWFKLEVGESGKTHAHVFANHDAALTKLPRGTTKQHKVRLIETPESAVSYLLKPALSESTEHLAIWIEARRANPHPKHLPHVSGFRNLPNRRTWGKA